MTAVVKAQSLTKRFSEVPAVTDVSFALEAGTVTGFLGPNGAGKTTTLRMILGLVAPSRIHSMSACQPAISSQHRLSVIGGHSSETSSWPSRLERRILSEQTGEFSVRGAPYRTVILSSEALQSLLEPELSQAPPRLTSAMVVVARAPRARRCLQTDGHLHHHATTRSRHGTRADRTARARPEVRWAA